MAGQPAGSLQQDLLAWFDTARRRLPWRDRPSLYGTWISEMMLQQTTVATVIPYWERFMKSFPDVERLAAASEPEVMAHWSGLGYYRRARLLHEAARTVAATPKARLPADYEAWRRLPGVGPYAAGAIASIGLNEVVPAVDANARRVIRRWSARSLAAMDGMSPRSVDQLARELVSTSRPGDWNEALMELGALVCRAGAPVCAECPVTAHCLTFKSGLSELKPPVLVRPTPTQVQTAVVAIICGDRVRLEPAGAKPLPCMGGHTPVRDDFSTLHAGLLTLPMTCWYLPPPAGPSDLAAALSGAWPTAADPVEPVSLINVGRFRHSITRYRLTVEVLVADLASIFPDPEVGATADSGSPIWVPFAQADRLHLSQLARKALRAVRQVRG